jgi:thioredoxin-dependent peroxiredoxin
VSLRSFFGLGLPVGSLAPSFCLPDQRGDLHRLEHYRGRRVLLYFYPKDATRGCTLEACSFRDSLSGFEELGIKVLGISTDTVASHLQFAEHEGLNFPILADSDREVCRAFQVLLPVGIAARVTFLIDAEGIIEKNIKFRPWKNYAQQVLEDLR